MYRWLLIGAMLFVLLWTGTLLHDIAESDEPSEFVAASVQTMRLDAPQLKIARPDVSAEEHCHDSVLASRSGSIDIHLHRSQIQTSYQHNLWFSSSAICAAAFCQRGPPAYKWRAKSRLYICKRALLL